MKALQVSAVKQKRCVMRKCKEFFTLWSVSSPVHFKLTEERGVLYLNNTVLPTTS